MKLDIGNPLEDCQFTCENKSYNSNISSFNTNVKSYRKSCLFCSKCDETYKCAEFNTIEKRLNQCRVMKLCFNCLSSAWKAYRQPLYANLPKERVCKAKPFQACGVDYTRAVLLNDNIKVYILLFTCAVTRAVHLELADDLTEDEYLFAFRRFLSIRSFPRVIFSDNALTFQSASKTLRNYLSDNRVEWKIITPRAPWQGGFWVRLIGLTKQHLGPC